MKAEYVNQFGADATFNLFYLHVSISYFVVILEVCNCFEQNIDVVSYTPEGNSPSSYQN